LRQKLVTNARKLVEEKYSWSEIGRNFCNLVENTTA
jgi:hypothetical protein